MRGVLLLSILVAATVACGDDPCDPTTEHCTYKATVSTVEVGAGVEDEDMCQSWTLNNPTELWVSGIKQHNGGAYHHANWFFVPDDEFKLPDGAWRCNENRWDALVGALLGGYLFALSTQSTDESQQLPEGSAIRIPPYSRVIGESHLLNSGDEPITTAMELEIHTVPPSEVQAKLAPARIQYHDLHLEPMVNTSFTTECTLADEYFVLRDRPLEYKLYYTLSHYHSLGMYAELQIAGGPRDGEVIMRHEGYGENFGQAIEPPLDLAAAGATGLRFTCGFRNPRPVEVNWGIGDQEMCVIALQAVTSVGWDGDAQHNTGQRVGVAPDGEVRYTAPCSLNMFPWDFEKPGGPGR